MPNNRKRPPQPPLVFKPQGKQNKRTPSSAFDPAAGQDVYEPEKVVAQRLAKGVTQFCVKWANYDAKHNTWEPVEHLAGCEDLIAEFKEREKTRLAQLEAAAQEKQRQKEEDKSREAAEAAAAAAQVRLKRKQESGLGDDVSDDGGNEEESAGPSQSRGPKKPTRRSSICVSGGSALSAPLPRRATRTAS